MVNSPENLELNKPEEIVNESDTGFGAFSFAGKRECRISANAKFCNHRVNNAISQAESQINTDIKQR